MVLGMPTTGSPCSESRAAADSVPSPPMATTASMPCFAAFDSTFSSPPSTVNGFTRLVPRMVPPRCRMPAVFSRVRGKTRSSMSPFQPSRSPSTSKR